MSDSASLSAHIPQNGENSPPVEASIGDRSLERIASAFETGMRRWELIIYPALFAFVVLAAYGFFLIYSLTRDVERLAGDVSRMADAVAPAMNSMSNNMAKMNADIHQMNSHTAGMTVAIHQMNASLWDMNRNISPPMDAFNSMMPWGNAAPAISAPPPLMPAYPQPVASNMMYAAPQYYGSTPQSARPAATEKPPTSAQPQGAPPAGALAAHK